MEQFKETIISKSKESSKDKVEKIFSKIYNYVFKRLKTENIMKNFLTVEQAEFLGNIDNDTSLGKVKLYSDLSQQELKAFIMHPGTVINIGQVVLVGYWRSINNLFILGPIEKKGVATNVTT